MERVQTQECAGILMERSGYPYGTLSVRGWEKGYPRAVFLGKSRFSPIVDNPRKGVSAGVSDKVKNRKEVITFG